MSEKQAWNMLRACFYLLAGIIWAQIVGGYGIMAICAYSIFSHLVPAGSCKEFAPNIMELLVGGMAVVIAFSSRGEK